MFTNFGKLQPFDPVKLEKAIDAVGNKIYHYHDLAATYFGYYMYPHPIGAYYDCARPDVRSWPQETWRLPDVIVPLIVGIQYDICETQYAAGGDICNLSKADRAAYDAEKKLQEALFEFAADLCIDTVFILQMEEHVAQIWYTVECNYQQPCLTHHQQQLSRSERITDFVMRSNYMLYHKFYRWYETTYNGSIAVIQGRDA